MESLESRLARLAEHLKHQRDRAFQIADVLISIKKEFGKTGLQRASQVGGLGDQAIKQYVWVAKAYPPGDPLRQLPLTYAHFRTAAKYSNRGEWLRKAVEEGWTKAQLANALKAHEEGVDFHRDDTWCANPACTYRITRDSGTCPAVSVHLQSGLRKWACSLKCLRKYIDHVIERGYA